jgi:hypothetical protein
MANAVVSNAAKHLLHMANAVVSNAAKHLLHWNDPATRKYPAAWNPMQRGISFFRPESHLNPCSESRPGPV